MPAISGELPNSSIAVFRQMPDVEYAEAAGAYCLASLGVAEPPHWGLKLPRSPAGVRWDSAGLRRGRLARNLSPVRVGRSGCH